MWLSAFLSSPSTSYCRLCHHLSSCLHRLYLDCCCSLVGCPVSACLPMVSLQHGSQHDLFGGVWLCLPLWWEPLDGFPTSLSENPLYKPVATVVCVLWSSFMSLTSFLTPVSLAHLFQSHLPSWIPSAFAVAVCFYLWSSLSPRNLISFKSLLKCCFLSLPLIMVFKIASPLPTLPGTLILVPCFCFYSIFIIF